MLRPVPTLAPEDENGEMQCAHVARLLRDYAAYIERDETVVACALIVMDEDGIAQTWTRAYEGAKTRLAEHLQAMGDDLAEGVYGAGVAEERLQ